jgi:uncharacterized protein
MPINAGYEYIEAEKKWKEATTDMEKLRGLENMLSTAPSHKGAETLRAQIKTKISKLKKKQENERKQKKGGQAVTIKKEGSARVILLGLPNSGKSYVLSKITNAKPEIAEYEHTTQKPEIGAIDYEGVILQTVELPAIFNGFTQSANGPMYFGIIRDSDLIVLVLDGSKSPEAQLILIDEEFKEYGLKLGKEYGGLNCLILVNKEFKYINTIHKVTKLEDAKEAIWDALKLAYVFTKTPGKKADYPPVALKKGATVQELADKVHKDFLTKFKNARLWGKSVKHQGANVGLGHVVQDGDTVEFHLK